jgi:phage head maturation protease
MKKQILRAVNNLQRLTIPLVEYQSSDSTDATGKVRGTWQGYANLKGFLENNYGSIFADGCYNESIPSFLKNGFSPDSHGAAQNFEYTVLGTYGYPTAAREDAKGLYFEGKFHSDEAAQTLRTRASERAADGLSVGMSIGFLTTKSFRIYPKDYETLLPKYLAKQFLAQGLEDAKGWTSILIRQKVQLIENSLTLTPAMDAALVTEVQSMNDGTKDYFEDIDESLALNQMSSLMNCLYYAGYDCFCNEDIPIESRRANWTGALSEFTDRLTKIFDTYSASETNEDDTNEMAKNFFLSHFIEPKFYGTLEVPNTELRERAQAVVLAYVNRLSSQAEKSEERKKLGTLSGKPVSKANWESVKANRDAIVAAMSDHSDTMKECIGNLDEFLDKYNPNKETESQKINADALNLRAKILRSQIEQPIYN